MRTSVPTDGSLATSTVPPCSSVSCLASGSPDPGAFEALGQAIVDLAEILERGHDFVRRHADAGVPDRDAKAAAVLQRG